MHKTVTAHLTYPVQTSFLPTYYKTKAYYLSTYAPDTSSLSLGRHPLSLSVKEKGRGDPTARVVVVVESELSGSSAGSSWGPAL